MDRQFGPPKRIKNQEIILCNVADFQQKHESNSLKGLVFLNKDTEEIRHPQTKIEIA